MHPDFPSVSEEGQDLRLGKAEQLIKRCCSGMRVTYIQAFEVALFVGKPKFFLIPIPANKIKALNAQS